MLSATETGLASAHKLLLGCQNSAWNRLDLRFSQLKKMSVYGKGMSRIGKVVDVELDLERRSIKGLIVKVEGEEARRAWKGRLHFRSPKILIPAEIIAGVKDAVLLQGNLNDAKDRIERV
jgi:sporulation protein YlmC with PRC-barrel domain